MTLDYNSNNLLNPEYLLIGHLIGHPEDNSLVMNTLSSHHLESSELKVLFKIMQDAFYKGEVLDLVLLVDKLKQVNKLDVVGGISFLSTLASVAGSGVDVSYYAEVVKQKFIQNKLKILLKKAEDSINIASQSSQQIIANIQSELATLEKSVSFSQNTTAIQDRLQDLDDMFRLYRGKKYIGLCQKTLPEFDDNLLGLRKLILLAAQPNVGKTALTVQLALDTVKNNPDACMVYFSLEMSSKDIILRMMCNLAQIDYKTLVFGSLNQDRSSDPDAYFSKDELDRINQSKKDLLNIGNRIQVFDTKEIPSLDSRTAIALINKIKEETQCSRVIVIVDYLQVWPLDQNNRFASEVEIDKWRIGEMKKIRDAINDDPIIVISEARKPSGNEEVWADNMSAVMGSARGTYTPDVVMLFAPIADKELEKLLNPVLGKLPGNSSEEKVELFKSLMSKKGKALSRIKVPKARDGMNKFSTILEFNFLKNTFKSIESTKLQSYLEDCIKNSSIKPIGQPINVFSIKQNKGLL